MLAAQERVDGLIAEILDAVGTGDADHRPPSLGRLQDLDASARAALAAIHFSSELPLHARDLLVELKVTDPRTLREDQSHGGSQPLQARSMAFAMAVATHMLRNGLDELQPDTTRWLLTTAHGVRKNEAIPTAGKILTRWDRATPELQGVLLKELASTLQPHERLRYRTASPRPSAPARGTAIERSRKVPTCLWRGIALPLTPPGLFGRLPIGFRVALSRMVLAVGSGTTQEEARRLLFNYDPAGLGLQYSAMTSKLQRSGHLDQVLSAVTQLADHLDEHNSPIDYARRRAQFLNADLDWQALAQFYDAVGRTRPAPPEQRLLRVRLIERLTGTHPRFLMPPMNLAGAHVHVYERAGLRLHADVSDHLDDQASRLLQQAGINEPIRWEPPQDWINLATCDLPGPAPDGIPTARLWTAVRSGDGVEAIASQLSTSIEHIRLTAERHPLPTGKSPTSCAPKIPRNRTPTTKELQELIAQGLSNRNIAKALGYSNTFVRRLLCERGLTSAFLSGGQRSIHIDPNHLRHEYEVKHRTYAAIAESMGVSTHTIRARAAELGIVSRKDSREDHPLAQLGGPDDFPPAVWDTFTGKGAETRVRRLLLITALPTSTIAAAARSLNITPCNVHATMKKLERAAGTTLFRRSTKGMTTNLTPAGEVFAHAIRESLSRVDAARTTSDTSQARTKGAAEQTANFTHELAEAP
ncbi:LysR family transcriptional regulator [Streptomyces sp. CB03238]|uniref:helix-turn-helix domain-containing protein n=1 Tax=Streptomyces sp. CB03238 TaxID=1907777 RepID=UPI001F4E7412|nr:LysR family transcriptional regulator [Streptomyces sp. CB03238]